MPPTGAPHDMRAVALALFLVVLPLAPAPSAHASSLLGVDLTVDGEIAHGWMALPSEPCRGVVVIARGYSHDAADHIAHLEHLAEQGFVAIAMDYRGDPDLTAFPLRAGASDTKAATLHAIALCPGKTVYLYSVSMGTAVAGIVLAEMPGVFSYWVDNEGLAMLTETWAGATVLAPVNGFAATASAAIETECGGTPLDAPACYLERSAALRAPEFAGLQGAILTHGLNDGLVPYDQGREMATALRAIGVPVEFHTVVRGNAGGEGTTITGYAGQNVDGLAGHGTEDNDAHTLTALSFRLLDELLAGATPTNAEHVVDRDVETLA